MVHRNYRSWPSGVLKQPGVALLILGSFSGTGRGEEPLADLRAQALDGLRRAVSFFRSSVAAEGGYLWRYSEDLARREGEGRAGVTAMWVQPPGTPSVGMAYLKAYRATGDRYYLEGAREAGEALIRGQLRSGGWDYRVELDPPQRERYAYRVDPPRPDARNTTTLDDDTTQAAILFLARLDQALDFKDEWVDEAARYALDRLLEAQYPNGAWPQRFAGPPDPARYPVKKASYPETWSRTYPGEDYRGYYTFNDNVVGDMVDLLLEVARIYADPRYSEAARRSGDFILLAQMPAPQPAWAQQYDAEMHPAWARKFEPPAVTGGESQGVLETLLELHEATGDPRYLELVPKALAYLRGSLLPDGRLARFYELRTNRPLYFTRDYTLTYRDDDLPAHYAFKVSQRLDRIEREYGRLRAGKRRVREERSAEALAGAARRVLAALDGRGRWVEEGRLRYHGESDPARRVIDCGTFVRNVEVLCAFIEAVGVRGE